MQRPLPGRVEQPYAQQRHVQDSWKILEPTLWYLRPHHRCPRGETHVVRAACVWPYQWPRKRSVACVRFLSIKGYNKASLCQSSSGLINLRLTRFQEYSSAVSRQGSHHPQSVQTSATVWRHTSAEGFEINLPTVSLTGFD